MDFDTITLLAVDVMETDNNKKQLTSWVEQPRSNLYKDGKVTGARFPSDVPGQTIVPQPTTVSQPLRTSESEPSEKSPLQALFPTTDINLPDNS